MSLNFEAEREAQIAHALRTPLKVDFVNHKVFDAGSGARDEIVTTARLILILKGCMTYRLEQQVFELQAGTQFLVPAWVRRHWQVPEGHTCEIIWCIFDNDSGGESSGEFVSRRLDTRGMQREKKAYLEMLRPHEARLRGENPRLNLLAMEAMLKAMLGRFWINAEPSAVAADAPAKLSLHPAVKQALRWMEHHYHEQNVIETLYAQSDLTPNYLRKHFKDSLKSSPQAYLQRLRLRHARHLLRSKPWQQKRIAAEVGYDDPLYFSRLYTRFWGRSPSEDRASVRP